MPQSGSLGAGDTVPAGEGRGEGEGKGDDAKKTLRYNKIIESIIPKSETFKKLKNNQRHDGVIQIYRVNAMERIKCLMRKKKL